LEFILLPECTESGDTEVVEAANWSLGEKLINPVLNFSFILRSHKLTLKRIIKKPNFEQQLSFATKPLLFAIKTMNPIDQII